MIIGLSQLGEHESPPVRELLARDVDDVLRPFERPSAGWLQVVSEHAAPLTCSLRHVCSLFRIALELCGGRREPRQHAFDPEPTVADNMQLYSCLVEIEGTADIKAKSFDPESVRSTLARSRLFVGGSESSTIRWIDQIKNSLPIWYSDGHLVSDSTHPVQIALSMIGYSPVSVEGVG